MIPILMLVIGYVIGTWFGYKAGKKDGYVNGYSVGTNTYEENEIYPTHGRLETAEADEF